MSNNQMDREIQKAKSRFLGVYIPNTKGSGSGSVMDNDVDDDEYYN